MNLLLYSLYLSYVSIFLFSYSSSNNSVEFDSNMEQSAIDSSLPNVNKFYLIDPSEILPKGLAYQDNEFNKTFSNTVSADTTLPEQLERFSAKNNHPLKIVFDYSHRELPSLKIGEHLITGDWIDSKGRYAWNDFGHPNSFDPIYIALGKEFSIFMNTKPINNHLLRQTDALVIFNPDNPKMVPNTYIMDNHEIGLLQNFVENGGSLMVMINAVGKGRESESFEHIQLRKLVRGFGLDWKAVDTHYSDIAMPDNPPYFYDIDRFHYGAGTTLRILPNAKEPETLLDVYSNKGYSGRKVKGPGIVMVRPGEGKFILVGDTGSWTGNLSRPWAGNRRLLKQLFRYLKPSQGVSPPQYNRNDTLGYKISIAGLQAIPPQNTLSSIRKPGYNVYKSKNQTTYTQLPYYEVSANADLIYLRKLGNMAKEMKIKLGKLNWFKQKKSLKHQYINFQVSRQGNVSNTKSTGYYAKWMQTELTSTIGLIPGDGIRPGDSWNLEGRLKIPIIKESDLAPIIKIPLQIDYVKNEKIKNRNCRLFRSMGSIWLDKAGISVSDLLPEKKMTRLGSIKYQYLTNHGGRLLYKKEQWIDMNTGIVVKSRIQVRIAAWIHDLTKPIGVNDAEIDPAMITILANKAEIKLKE